MPNFFVLYLINIQICLQSAEGSDTNGFDKQCNYSTLTAVLFRAAEIIFIVGV